MKQFANEKYINRKKYYYSHWSINDYFLDVITTITNYSTNYYKEKIVNCRHI